MGVMTSRLLKNTEGTRTPLFDLYRRDGDGLGEIVATGLALDDLLVKVRTLG
jgi:hypothetical protein